MSGLFFSSVYMLTIFFPLLTVTARREAEERVLCKCLRQRNAMSTKDATQNEAKVQGLGSCFAKYVR